jgi:hypothetical protein
MKRLLIVSPHFPPSNAADMQRVRLLLPYFRDSGFDPVVLAVSPECVAAPRDPWMQATLPHDVPVHRVSVMGLSWCRIPGLGTLSNRAMGGLDRAGRQILAGTKHDLVYFSTTQFGLHRLGPTWKRQFGVPFVMDYQDPWVNDYYRKNPDVVPPGGRLKYGVADWMNRHTEPRVLRHCSGVTSVSQAYLDSLHERYSFLEENWPTLVAPFPGDDRDLQAVAADPSIRQSFFDPLDGCQHWLYIGRGGQDMHRSARALFTALSLQRRHSPESVNRIRLHFIGTSYAAAGKGTKTIAPLAIECGVGDLVDENTDRIPFSQTLQCLLDADALIVPGSDDPGYTASKIYPYLFAKKPMLAIFNERSSIVDIIRSIGGAALVTFDDSTSTATLAENVRTSWFLNEQFRRVCPLDVGNLQPYLARTQAEQFSAFFAACLSLESSAC